MGRAEAITAELSLWRSLGVLKRTRRIPLQVLPIGVEREYARALLSLFGPLEEALKPILEALPRLTREARAEILRNDAVRNDKSVDEAISLLETALGQSEVTQNSIERLSSTIASRTKNHNTQQMSKQVKAAIGIDIFAGNTNLQSETSAFVFEQTSLIKGILPKVHEEISGIVMRGVSGGRLAGDIAKDIKERMGIGKRRAALIARDQVGKFYGAVNRKKQQDLGLTKFRWRSVGDERVRDSHKARDGKVYSWDDPPSDGIPGQPINCRCTAEPVFDELMGEDTPVTPGEKALKKAKNRRKRARKKAKARKSVPALTKKELKIKKETDAINSLLGLKAERPLTPEEKKELKRLKANASSRRSKLKAKKKEEEAARAKAEALKKKPEPTKTEWQIEHEKREAARQEAARKKEELAQEAAAKAKKPEKTKSEWKIEAEARRKKEEEERAKIWKLEFEKRKAERDAKRKKEEEEAKRKKEEQIAQTLAELEALKAKTEAMQAEADAAVTKIKRKELDALLKIKEERPLSPEEKKELKRLKANESSRISKLKRKRKKEEEAKKPEAKKPEAKKPEAKKPEAMTPWELELAKAEARKKKPEDRTPQEQMWYETWKKKEEKKKAKLEKEKQEALLTTPEGLAKYEAELLKKDPKDLTPDEQTKVHRIKKRLKEAEEAKLQRWKQPLTGFDPERAKKGMETLGGLDFSKNGESLDAIRLILEEDIKSRGFVNHEQTRKLAFNVTTTKGRWAAKMDWDGEIQVKAYKSQLAQEFALRVAEGELPKIQETWNLYDKEEKKLDVLRAEQDKLKADLEVVRKDYRKKRNAVMSLKNQRDNIAANDGDMEAWIKQNGDRLKKAESKLTEVDATLSLGNQEYINFGADLRTKEHDLSQTAMAKKAKQYYKELDGLMVIHHEVHHGFGPVGPRGYKSVGILVEEISTETMSRYDAREAYGLPISISMKGAAYQRGMTSARKTIMKHYGVDATTAVEMLEKGSGRFRKRSKKMSDPKKVFELFIDDMTDANADQKTMTPKEKISFRAAFRKIKL